MLRARLRVVTRFCRGLAAPHVVSACGRITRITAAARGGARAAWLGLTRPRARARVRAHSFNRTPVQAATGCRPAKAGNMAPGRVWRHASLILAALLCGAVLAAGQPVKSNSSAIQSRSKAAPAARRCRPRRRARRPRRRRSSSASRSSRDLRPGASTPRRRAPSGRPQREVGARAHAPHACAPPLPLLEARAPRPSPPPPHAPPRRPPTRGRRGRRCRQRQASCASASAPTPRRSSATRRSPRSRTQATRRARAGRGGGRGRGAGGGGGWKGGVGAEQARAQAARATRGPRTLPPRLAPRRWSCSRRSPSAWTRSPTLGPGALTAWSGARWRKTLQSPNGTCLLAPGLAPGDWQSTRVVDKAGARRRGRGGRGIRSRSRAARRRARACARQTFPPPPPPGPPPARRPAHPDPGEARGEGRPVLPL